jgi:hypothetical protein
MRVDLPPSVQDTFFDFHWDQVKLWAVPGLVRSVSLVELAHCLDLPIWRRYNDQKLFDLAPSEVLRNLSAFPAHQARIVNADFRRPIIVMPNLHGQPTIMDGFHRFARACLDGAPSIHARFLSREVIPEISVKAPPGRSGY